MFVGHARARLCLPICDPMDCGLQSTRLLCLWNFQARILEPVAISYPGELPDPGIKPVSLALAGGFFTTEPPGNAGHY